MHSILALIQFEHGVLLLQRTFLRRHVTQLREWRGSCEDCEVLFRLEGMLKLLDKLLGWNATPLPGDCDSGFTRGVDSTGGNDMAKVQPPSGTRFFKACSRKTQREKLSTETSSEDKKRDYQMKVTGFRRVIAGRWGGGL